jgi:hypothetical protein
MPTPAEHVRSKNGAGYSTARAFARRDISQKGTVMSRLSKSTGKKISTKRLSSIKQVRDQDNLTDAVPQNTSLTVWKSKSPTTWLTLKTAGRDGYIAMIDSIFGSPSNDEVDRLIRNARSSLISLYPAQKFGNIYVFCQHMQLT